MQKNQILSPDSLREKRDQLHVKGKTLAFTNGCFDILHAGHIQYLQFAREQADALCVAINSDASVQRHKGPKRPIIPQADRAALLCSLRCVDYVTIFDEDEPRIIISRILPDVLVKGNDWAHYVSGRDIVEANGGRVVLAEILEARSTTRIIQRILDAYGTEEPL